MQHTERGWGRLLDLKRRFPAGTLERGRTAPKNVLGGKRQRKAWLAFSI